MLDLIKQEQEYFLFLPMNELKIQLSAINLLTNSNGTKIQTH